MQPPHPPRNKALEAVGHLYSPQDWLIQGPPKGPRGPQGWGSGAWVCGRGVSQQGVDGIVALGQGWSRVVPHPHLGTGSSWPSAPPASVSK